VQSLRQEIILFKETVWFSELLTWIIYLS
jgi:hypothetical protein